MKRTPVRRDSSGCLAFLSTCAKAFVVALPAALVALVVGGDELRGVMAAFITLPVVFLGLMIYFTSRPKSGPAPRKMAEFKKRSD